MRTSSDIQVGRDSMFKKYLNSGYPRNFIRITKCDRSWLQIVIGFGLQSATKILKNELQSTMGLQTATQIAKWYSIARTFKD